MNDPSADIVRATKEHIGALTDVGPQGCCWCDNGGQDYVLANGERICDECGGLAREVGDGTLAVVTCNEYAESSRSSAFGGPYYRYRLRSALHLTVWVEHLRPDVRDDGVPWLCGVPATTDDRRMAQDLGLFVQATWEDDRVGAMGVNREDLLHNMAACITSHLGFLREDLAHCDPDERLFYQEMLLDAERHIAEVEQI